MIEWSHSLQLSIKLNNIFTRFLIWSVFPEDATAEETAFDKSEVDARSIYVGNVSLFSLLLILK
jgi:hypothetical protein